MTWIDDHKGEGPWDFTKQPDKPCYNEGNLISCEGESVWGDAFLTSYIGAAPVTPEHNPYCGYWPTPTEVSLNADIFILNWAGPPTIYGVNFDGRRLSWVGSYQPTDLAINGLILYENDLLTIAGEGATAELRRVSTAAVREEFSLLNTYGLFNSYDIRVATNGRLINGDINKFYYSDITTIMVSVHDLVRNKRGFRNTVITGTDDNLYVLNASAFWWEDSWRPITGDNWSLFWNLIEDNICDTTVGVWGGDLIKCASGEIDQCYHDGYLYTGDLSSYDSPITKINPTTLETVARYPGLYINRITAHGDKIYVIGGLTSVTVYIFNVSDLSLVCSRVLPDGRSSNGDLEVVGNYLIVSSASYGDPNATLYKLSLEDLTVLDSVSSIVGTDALGGQRLAVVNDIYLAVAWNGGISIYDIETMGVVSRLCLEDIVGSGDDFGYHAQAMVVKHR